MNCTTYSMPPTAVFLLVAVLSCGLALADERQIPDALQPWQDWATWDDSQAMCPPIYSDAGQRICYWPSELKLDASPTGAKWEMQVHAFDETWVALPGSKANWPVEVQVDGRPIVVVERKGMPHAKLPAGKSQLSGALRWNRMPQSVLLPPSIGMLELTVDAKAVPTPNWDGEGNVWLRRVRSLATDKDLISAKVYRVVEDGIPVWLRSEIELTVSGKSREEELGNVLPQHWKISKVTSPIPVAVDDSSAMKAQVRAGKWKIVIDAFRTQEFDEVSFAPDSKPIVDRELIGLKKDPAFRVTELAGLPTIDVSQTEFPIQWRDLPVHQWDTSQPFQLIEKMRGMGEKRQQGLSLTRELWLDEDGAAFTYQDRFHGTMQQIWRLDVNEGNELGAVRIDGETQLITANPETGASGVEIRRRNLDLEAIGRVPRAADVSATGWRADAESLKVAITMPPGWRAFAVLGADDVSGDWLTAWSLLDLFLVLIFSLAVFRLYGVTAGLIALLAFALSYHELGAPRFTWLLLLVPLALSRVVGEGAALRWINAMKYLATGTLLLCLVPFVARQIQDTIYPQLEPAGFTYGSRGALGWPTDSFRSSSRSGATIALKSSVELAMPQARAAEDLRQRRSKFESSNLLQDPQSTVQTGPARPQWGWNSVTCRWTGPVSSDQTIRPILLSSGQNRCVNVIRVALLLLLATLLLRGKVKRRSEGTGKAKKVTVAAAAVFALVILPTTAMAQIPDAEMLDTLRQRMLQAPDVFPGAADIASVEMAIDGSEIEMIVDVHAAADVAVPLPGKLPAWSPVSISSDQDETPVVIRRDGFLWVLAKQGVQRFTVKGRLASESDWEWSFLLKPRYAMVTAKGWKVTGINQDGIPDSQVFLTREQNLAADTAAYDRVDFEPIVVVDRYFEIGLISKVRTVVTRLSSTGKAVSLDIPLLSGESVLNDRIQVSDNRVAVRMNAVQKQMTWESELPPGQEINLVSDPAGDWVERWHLITSPIWNVSINGLAPIFEESQRDLIPVWHPWPSETATIQFGKPTAIIGEVMTVQRVAETTTLGHRQRTYDLELDVECSLADDFIVQMDRDAEVMSLRRDGQAIPVQRDGDKLIIPVNPGQQTIAAQWKTAAGIETVIRSSEISLPTDASNVTRAVVVPENRWVLWASGPRRGPAVRFWTILLVALLAAIALGFLPHSPLRRIEWVLLVIGLTQVHIAAAMTVIGWLFLLAWRGNRKATVAKHWSANGIQILIVLATFVSLAILMVVVGKGLLGSPDMFIVGNGSSQTFLQWFQPRIGSDLPTTMVVSISVWFYRFLMLCWALWLANALLRWLTWGWHQFSVGGVWHRSPNVISAKIISADETN